MESHEQAFKSGTAQEVECIVSSSHHGPAVGSAGPRATETPRPGAPCRSSRLRNNSSRAQSMECIQLEPVQAGVKQEADADERGREVESPSVAGDPSSTGGPNSGLDDDDQNRLLRMDDLRPHFFKSRMEAAECLKVSINCLKAACRRNGVERWPYRKLQSLVSLTQSMQARSDKQDLAGVQEIQQEVDRVVANPNHEVDETFLKLKLSAYKERYKSRIRNHAPPVFIRSKRAPGPKSKGRTQNERQRKRRQPVEPSKSPTTASECTISRARSSADLAVGQLCSSPPPLYDSDEALPALEGLFDDSEDYEALGVIDGTASIHPSAQPHHGRSSSCSKAGALGALSSMPCLIAPHRSSSSVGLGGAPSTISDSMPPMPLRALPLDGPPSGCAVAAPQGQAPMQQLRLPAPASTMLRASERSSLTSVSDVLPAAGAHPSPAPPLPPQPCPPCGPAPHPLLGEFPLSAHAAPEPLTMGLPSVAVGAHRAGAEQEMSRHSSCESKCVQDVNIVEGALADRLSSPQPQTGHTLPNLPTAPAGAAPVLQQQQQQQQQWQQALLAHSSHRATQARTRLGSPRSRAQHQQRRRQGQGGGSARGGRAVGGSLTMSDAYNAVVAMGLARERAAARSQTSQGTDMLPLPPSSAPASLASTMAVQAAEAGPGSGGWPGGANGIGLGLPCVSAPWLGGTAPLFLPSQEGSVHSGDRGSTHRPASLPECPSMPSLPAAGSRSRARGTSGSAGVDKDMLLTQPGKVLRLLRTGGPRGLAAAQQQEQCGRGLLSPQPEDLLACIGLPSTGTPFCPAASGTLGPVGPPSSSALTPASCLFSPPTVASLSTVDAATAFLLSDTPMDTAAAPAGSGLPNPPLADLLAALSDGDQGGGCEGPEACAAACAPMAPQEAGQGGLGGCEPLDDLLDALDNFQDPPGLLDIHSALLPMLPGADRDMDDQFDSVIGSGLW